MAPIVPAGKSSFVFHVPLDRADVDFAEPSPPAQRACSHHPRISCRLDSLPCLQNHLQSYRTRDSGAKQAVRCYRGYSFCFEADDTDAGKGVESFGMFYRSKHGVRHFKRLSIKKDSLRPAWDVMASCDHIVKSPSPSGTLVLLDSTRQGGADSTAYSVLDCYTSRVGKQSFQPFGLQLHGTNGVCF